MELNFVGKMFLGALALCAVKKIADHESMKALTQYAKAGEWDLFNQCCDNMDGEGEPSTLDERLALWKKLLVS
jgi:hypothetical protein